jgi:hypothetical protein
MYRCEVCKTVVSARVPSHRLIVATRTVRYPHRDKVHFRPADEGGKGKWIDDPGGIGDEIAREVTVCPDCAGGQRQLAAASDLEDDLPDRAPLHQLA